MSFVALAPPTQHIIPVTDERLNFPRDAEKGHRDKINTYNDMLEDIFHRELELAKLKASLVDMKAEIVDGAQTLDTHGNIIPPSSLNATKAGEISADDSNSSGGEDSLSDGAFVSGSGSEDAPGLKKALKKKRASKGKSKGKGRDATRTEERGASWDYNLNVTGGARRGHLAVEDDD